MNNREEIQLSSVQLVPEFTTYDTGENIVWIPDSSNLKLRRQSDSEEVTETLHSYTSLEHILFLLNQLEKEESGDVLWGSSSIIVSFTGDKVVLAHKGTELIGSLESAERAIENIIRETFDELDRQGVNTREIARQLQNGRFASQKINPIDVHDRLTGR